MSSIPGEVVETKFKKARIIRTEREDHIIVLTMFHLTRFDWICAVFLWAEPSTLFDTVP